MEGMWRWRAEEGRAIEIADSKRKGGGDAETAVVEEGGALKSQIENAGER